MIKGGGRMYSIRKKISMLITGAMLSVSVSIVAMDIFYSRQFAMSNAQIALNSTCEAKTQELDNRMKVVQKAVEDIYLLSENERPPLDNFGDKELLDSYIDDFKKIAVDISGNTEGAIAVYYRINPDVSLSGQSGFFYVRSPETGEFTEHELTDILSYSPDDMEYVGWYYEPVRAGKPVWTEHYFNQNTGMDIISYVIPFYEGKRLVGVVGMDVDFREILNIAEDIETYDSGGSVLLCMSNSLMYHTSGDEFVSQSIPSQLYNNVLGKESSVSLADISSDGTRYKISYQTLSNRMKLVVYAPVSEIYQESNAMLLRSGLIILIFISIILLLTVRISDKIIRPLKSITDATKKFSEGDWQAEIECDTNDELMALTDSIRSMADNTRNYIARINDMAFRDGLTGVKNKACYMSFIDVLRERAGNSDIRFGIVVLDVNGLKTINDKKGHEYGDELLKNASSLICRYFSHSPVFRTGGDEFVVVMESADYDNRDKIIEDFRNYMMLHRNDNADECTPSVASGMACFPEDSRDISEVFRLADERMYENKVIIKGGAVPR